MEGMREPYERYLMWRGFDKLEEKKANIWTKINAAINEAKSFKLDAKKDSKDSQSEKELTYMDLGGAFDSLLGWRRDIRKSLRESERERYNARDRAEYIVSTINESEGMVRE